MVTCRLTACTPGSAPGPTLGIEYGKPLPFFTHVHRPWTWPMNAGVQNDAHVHRPCWSPVYPVQPMNAGVIFWHPSLSTARECGSWTQAVCTELKWHSFFFQAGCLSYYPTSNNNRFYGPLSGTTRVSWYKKKQSPTHHPDHHPIFISFFHLPRSIASSLFKLRAWQYFCTNSVEPTVSKNWRKCKEMTPTRDSQSPTALILY